MIFFQGMATAAQILAFKKETDNECLIGLTLTLSNHFSSGFHLCGIIELLVHSITFSANFLKIKLPIINTFTDIFPSWAFL